MKTDDRIREGRACDPRTVAEQIGVMTILAISGGRILVIRDADGESIGIAFPCGESRTVEVTLDFSDTYTVRRYRQIVRGERRGEFVTEFHADDIYCDQVAEVAYNASCWK